MAFYRCGGDSKPTTLINGVEAEQDITLKSIGISFTDDGGKLPKKLPSTTIKQDVLCVFYHSNKLTCITNDSKLWIWNELSSKWEQSSLAVPFTSIVCNPVFVPNVGEFFLVPGTASGNNKEHYIYKYTGGSFTLVRTFNLYNINVFGGMVLDENDKDKIHIIARYPSSFSSYYFEDKIYNISANTITGGSYMPQYLWYNSSVFYKGYIHTIGGQSGTSNARTKHYKGGYGSWTDVASSPPMNPSGGNWYMAADDKYLYINYGDWSYPVYRYNESTNTWTEIRLSTRTNNRAFFKKYGSDEIYSHRNYTSKPDTTDSYYGYDEGGVYRMVKNAFEMV